MPDPAANDYQHSMAEIRAARDQAEMLRDQLLAEYQRIRNEEADLPPAVSEDSRRRQGREAMRKAIAAANRAIASIDQALRELESAKNDFTDL